MKLLSNSILSRSQHKNTALFSISITSSIVCRLHLICQNFAHHLVHQWFNQAYPKMHFALLLPLLLLSPILTAGKHPKLPKIRCDETGQCFCPEDPLTEKYSDPEDPTCQHYYLCHLNRAYRKVCDVRTAFHPEKGDCIPRQQIPEKYCKFAVRCPLFHNLYVEDPHDCTKYYLCFYQRPSHYSCPEQAFFDPELQKCIQDQTQAEDCEEQAKLDNAARLRIEPTPKRTSSALSKAKENAAALAKGKPKPPPKPGKPDEHFIKHLAPLGQAVKGGSKNLF